jgi:hypothetical protein
VIPTWDAPPDTGATEPPAAASAEEEAAELGALPADDGAPEFDEPGESDDADGAGAEELPAVEPLAAPGVAPPELEPAAPVPVPLLPHAASARTRPAAKVPVTARWRK